MRYLLPATVLALALPSAAMAGKPTPATPLGSPGDWVGTADYPTEAMIAHVQGIVGFTLTVGSGGTVEKCEITLSSGSELLDVTACNAITLRARFRPATDDRGKATKGVYSNRLRWILPKTVPQPQPNDFEGVFVVETDGAFSGCQVLKGVASAEKTPCETGTTTTPFVDARGNPIRRIVRIRKIVTVEPATGE